MSLTKERRMDTTRHLLSRPNNARRLMEAVSELDARDDGGGSETAGR